MTKYFIACWVEDSECYRCEHKHRYISEAAECVPHDGGFVKVVDSGTVRSLDNSEKREYREILHFMFKQEDIFPGRTASDVGGGQWRLREEIPVLVLTRLQEQNGEAVQGSRLTEKSDLLLVIAWQPLFFACGSLQDE